jgi:glycosyltransferase involved in cell wall biosynthesis
LKKLNIGIIGTRGIPNQYGGFEQFAQYLSEGLVEKGHEVYVYCSHTHSYQQPEWNGVKLIHCKDPEHKWGTAGQFLYDKNCFADAGKRNFDILLHLGYTSDAVWHRRWPKNTIHMMNMDGLEWKRSKYNWLTKRFLKWAESLAAKNAGILIADSLAIQDHLLKRYNKKAIYIPYGATVFTNPDPGLLADFKLTAGNYFLVIARMEPENNIEMIIKGYLDATSASPLLIIGNMGNSYGKYIFSRYKNPGIIYTGAQYDQVLLNNLRYYSTLYFHGHSVGGTNPSLLEAMACGCTMAAHDNIFNKAILQQEADYFSTSSDVTKLMLAKADTGQQAQRKAINLQRIETIYPHKKIINSYEELMQKAVVEKNNPATPRK